MKPLSKAQNVTLKSANRSLWTESDINSSHNNFAHSRTMRRLRASFGAMVCGIVQGWGGEGKHDSKNTKALELLCSKLKQQLSKQIWDAILPHS